jgi:N-acetyl-gamma-glutamyl-phosphate reductase
MQYTKMIKVAIAGATGYTGGELLRILLNHPHAEITSLLTSSLNGQAVSSVHKDLYGDCALCFTDTLGEPDVLFLCLGHGLSREFLTKHKIPAHCKVIDLGNDFRVENKFEDKQFVYGIPELFRRDIGAAAYVANPGCFATAIILALAPLAAQKWLTDAVYIHALTGATGAGKQLAETSHFSYRASNISIYKAFTHQHLGEINKTFQTLSGGAVPKVNMIPVRGDFTRGIFTGILTTLPAGTTAEQVKDLFREFYKGALFVHPSDETVSLKSVVNTNKVLFDVEVNDGTLHITSILDNLIKGASGQAVQNMNLMCGIAEDCGLKLKSSVF